MSTLRPAAAGFVILLALSACSPQEVAPEKPRPVRTITVAPISDGEEIVQTGEIQPRYETSLGFRIDGRMASRSVDVGANVQPGQVIATIDDRDVRNELRSAEAELRSAQSAESLAKVALERQQALLAKDIVAQARVDEADANWASAKARREAAEASLANARNKLTYTNLTADRAGVVTAIGANAGQVVSAGQMVATVASTDEKEAVFSISESLVHGAPPDLGVAVALVSDPAVKVVGQVREVSPTADPVTRTYRVRVTLPDAPKSMGFGATVTGRVVVPTGQLITVPAAAIANQGDTPAVYVVDTASATLVRKPVIVARYTDANAVISSGLTAGDKVVTAGVSKLRPGQKIALDAEAGK
jgi:RND family efflux transporter MFP subunit